MELSTKSTERVKSNRLDLENKIVNIFNIEKINRRYNYG